MPSDALHYSFVAAELDALLSGGRIEKIAMPEKEEILLSVRAHGNNYFLIISASPACPRCHLTKAKKENPLVAPAFLMHLRKRIGGAKILSVKSVHCDRTVIFELSALGEMLYEERFSLVAEIMGKYSNIILVGSDGKISDCVKKVGFDVSSKRQILPGLTYLPAPNQDRIDPLDCEGVARALEGFCGGEVGGYLLKKVKGLSPASLDQAVFAALGRTFSDALDEGERKAIALSLSQLYDFTEAKPCLLLSESGSDFYLKPYSLCGGTPKFFDTLSEAMDEFFLKKTEQIGFDEKSRQLLAALKNAVSRTEKRLAGFLQKQLECRDFERDKIFGELLVSNLYRLRGGESQVVLENWYDDFRLVTVPLNPAKTASECAQEFFKAYNKKKKTLEQLKPLIADAEEKLDYYDSVMTAFSLCGTLSELNELREELACAGIVQGAFDKGKRKHISASKPTELDLGGFTVRIGRNNLQNDELTKTAKKEDIWLHTKAVHGSHVVIVSGGKEVPIEVVLKAAALAARHSKAAMSENVAVDYTQVRYVVKPHGAPPGKVVYTHQKTVFVNPAEK